MARASMSAAQKEAAALRATLRMVSQGERPLYRVTARPDGGWSVDGAPWIMLEASTRRKAIAAARTELAAWLEVDAGVIDVE